MVPITHSCVSVNTLVICILAVYSVIQILRSSIKQTCIIRSFFAEGRLERVFIFEALGLKGDGKNSWKPKRQTLSTSLGPCITPLNAKASF